MAALRDKAVLDKGVQTVKKSVSVTLEINAFETVLRCLALLTIATIGQPLAAAELVCPNRVVTVLADEPEMANRICGTSDRALSLFAECGFKLAGPIQIEMQTKIDPECFGVFHCDKGSIEVLRPTAMDMLREEDSLFASISTESYFDSVVVHELAHALYDGAPCPYEHCRATSEYFAYSYQIMSFNDQERALLERGLDIDRPIAKDYINSILAVMSPDAFAKRAWRHFSQTENQCSSLAGILTGEVVFDYEYP